MAKTRNAVEQRPKEEQDDLVRQYHDLVWYIVQRLWNSGVGRRLGTLEDLAQEGFLGLMHAARNYDPSYGVKFITYASSCIQRWCRREDQSSGLVHVPLHIVQTIQSGGRLDCRDAEARQEKAIRAMSVLTGTDPGPERAGHSRLERAVHDEPMPERSPRFDQALASLDARLRLVLTMRFGLDGNEAMTLNEVGELMDICKERVRQLESKAKKQLAKILGGQPSLN